MALYPPKGIDPHPFEQSEFGKNGLTYCQVCGATEPNPIHGPQEKVVPAFAVISRWGFFEELVQLVAKRGTCNRAQVGAVIEREGRVVSSGYNGAPPGMPHCYDVGCAPATGCERTVHAEANAIAFAARQGVSTQGASMWSTHGPCVNCAKLIVSAGIVEFHYLFNYHSQRVDILNDAGLKTVDHALAG